MVIEILFQYMFTCSYENFANGKTYLPKWSFENLPNHQLIAKYLLPKWRIYAKSGRSGWRPS